MSNSHTPQQCWFLHPELRNKPSQPAGGRGGRGGRGSGGRGDRKPAANASTAAGDDRHTCKIYISGELKFSLEYWNRRPRNKNYIIMIRQLSKRRPSRQKIQETTGRHTNIM